MSNKTQTVAITTLLMLCILVGGLIYNKSYELSQDRQEAQELEDKYSETGNSICTFLYIEHRNSEGDLIETMFKENDLILRNFVKMMLACMRDASAVDDQGQSFDINQPFYSSSLWNDYVALGTGTTAANITDYCLETETHRNQIYNRNVSTSGTQINATITGFFTFSGSYAITECGICQSITDAGNDEVFYTRDVFSAINVVATDTLSISVIIQFN